MEIFHTTKYNFETGTEQAYKVVLPSAEAQKVHEFQQVTGTDKLPRWAESLAQKESYQPTAEQAARESEDPTAGLSVDKANAKRLEMLRKRVGAESNPADEALFSPKVQEWAYNLKRDRDLNSANASYLDAVARGDLGESKFTAEQVQEECRANGLTIGYSELGVIEIKASDGQIVWAGTTVKGAAAFLGMAA